jgi:hypothetical protein
VPLFVTFGLEPVTEISLLIVVPDVIKQSAIDPELDEQAAKRLLEKIKPNKHKQKNSFRTAIIKINFT